MTEIDVAFASLDEWRGWAEQHPEIFHAGWIDEIGYRIAQRGFEEPLSGLCAAPGEITSHAPNWREGLVFAGINARNRAVMKVIYDLPASPAPDVTEIFAPEARSGFAARMRSIYPRFIGSEFIDDPTIRREDLRALSMASATLDLVATNDVLEHVAGLDTALTEIARVLRPGGRLVSTHPFYFFDERSQLRARMTHGKVEHLLEPEYHDDPVNPAGVLVFEIPGWDILQRCRDAGFSRAHMRYVLSERHGCLAPHVGGVFVLVAQR